MVENYDPPPNAASEHGSALRALLHWYADMGVDLATQETPANYYEGFRTVLTAPGSKANIRARPDKPPMALRSNPESPPQTAVIRPDQKLLSPDEAMATAQTLAAAADSIPKLEDAVRSFEHCGLKASARNTVFADGVPNAPLLVMGEAPGGDEDRIGKPFVGRAGQLLDRMLAAIGHSRASDTYISNVIYWRPPGNRNPTQEEIAICRPFVDRLIALSAPKVILLVGAVPLQALMGRKGIMRMRGKWLSIKTATGSELPVMPSFHPAYLLRNPQAKRLAWHDLQRVRARLREN